MTVNPDYVVQVLRYKDPVKARLPNREALIECTVKAANDVRLLVMDNIRLKDVVDANKVVLDLSFAYLLEMQARGYVRSVLNNKPRDLEIATPDIHAWLQVVWGLSVDRLKLPELLLFTRAELREAAIELMSMSHVA